MSINIGLRPRKFTANMTDGQTTEGIITSFFFDSTDRVFKIAINAPVPELVLEM